MCGAESGNKTCFPQRNSDFLFNTRIIPSLLHTHLYVNATLSRTNRRSWESLQRQYSFRNRKALGKKKNTLMDFSLHSFKTFKHASRNSLYAEIYG